MCRRLTGPRVSSCPFNLRVSVGPVVLQGSGHCAAAMHKPQHRTAGNDQPLLGNRFERNIGCPLGRRSLAPAASIGPFAHMALTFGRRCLDFGADSCRPARLPPLPFRSAHCGLQHRSASPSAGAGRARAARRPSADRAAAARNLRAPPASASRPSRCRVWSRTPLVPPCAGRRKSPPSGLVDFGRQPIAALRCTPENRRRHHRFWVHARPCDADSAGIALSIRREPLLDPGDPPSTASVVLPAKLEGGGRSCPPLNTPPLCILPSRKSPAAERPNQPPPFNRRPPGGGGSGPVPRRRPFAGGTRVTPHQLPRRRPSYGQQTLAKERPSNGPTPVPFFVRLEDWPATKRWKRPCPVHPSLRFPPPSPARLS